MDSRSFVHYLQQRASDGLRAVGIYTEAEARLAYYREDLDPAALEDTLQEFHRNVTRAQTSESRLEQRLGPEHASVQLHADGVVMRLSKADAPGGAVASFERDIARDLGLFAEKCFQQLYPE